MSGGLKRVFVRGEKMGPLMAALAEAEGMEVVEEVDDTVDLVVAELRDPAVLKAILSDRSIPALVVTPKRLRETSIVALRKAGATAIIDTGACLLDAAFALSDLLFDTYSEQFRYARRVGGIPVRYTRPGDETRISGRMIGIARTGGFIHCTAGPLDITEGTRIEMWLDIAGKTASIHGDVAYTTTNGFAVEFPIGESDVAPTLAALSDSAISRARI